MNHKRKRPKHQRAGCLLCKSYKDNRKKGSRTSLKKSDLIENDKALVDIQETMC